MIKTEVKGIYKKVNKKRRKKQKNEDWKKLKTQKLEQVKTPNINEYIRFMLKEM